MAIKPEIANLLFPKRIGTTDFLWRIMTVIAAFFGGAYVCRLIADISVLKDAAILLVCILTFLYLLYFVLFPRLVDIGLPRVTAALFLIVPVNILFALVLFFAPKDSWTTMKEKRQAKALARRQDSNDQRHP
jgi:hypothetical protein